jgi:hypothetical protein
MWGRPKGYRGGRRPSVDRLADPSPLPGEWPFGFITDALSGVVPAPDGSPRCVCSICSKQREEGWSFNQTPEERILQAMKDLPPAELPTVVLSVHGGGHALDLTVVCELDKARDLIDSALTDLEG